MAINTLINLPPLVGTRNDTWIKVNMTAGQQLVVKVYYAAILLTTMRMPADLSGNVALNIKRILQAIGTPPNLINADLPAYNQGFVSACSSLLKAFSITMDEINTADGSIISSINVQSTALLAGLNPELSFSMLLLDYLSGPPRKFLTNKALHTLTGKDSQQYLYYYNTNIDFNDVPIQVAYTIYYSDGSNSGVKVLATQLVMCVIVPAGYNQLNIDVSVPAGKQVLYYEVFVVDSGELSEKHLFEVDEKCYPDGRDFLFLNSLGGMDTLRIQQVEEINLERQSDVVESYVSESTELVDGQYYETEIQTNRKFKAQTSQLRAEERYWLQEFFASAKIFEIRNGKFLPVRIISGSALIKNKADYLAVNFEYRYRFEDIGYTKQ